jgi:WD40 repeat protein
MLYLVPNISVHPIGLSQYAFTVIIRDIQTRSIRHQLNGHTDAVMWIGISPDSLFTASISWDGTARIWDTYSGECLHIIGPLGGQLWCGVFSPDSTLLAISQGYPKSVSIYDIATEPLQLISRIEIPTWMRSMAWKPDGSLIAGRLENGSLLLLDPRTGMERGYGV